MKSGETNTILDVPDIEVGHFSAGTTGVTVVLSKSEDGAFGGVDVRGSAPGTRETDLLDPTNLVNKVNAIVLSGGSVYGLETANGVVRFLKEKGRGFSLTEDKIVPIVPSAVLFDLGFAENYDFWTGVDPSETSNFGRKACQKADDTRSKWGNVGAGAGATAGNLKGGLGSASCLLENGITIGAIAVVNSFGSPVNPATGELYGERFEVGDEFGPTNKEAKPQKESPSPSPPKETPGANTTLGVVALNANLDKAEATKVSQMAQDGLARVLIPAHTMFDGDTIFTMATGEVNLEDENNGEEQGRAARINRIGEKAAETFSRAATHAILEAESEDDYQCFRDAHLHNKAD